MANNPPSFRIAFESQIADLPPEHQQVIRTIMNKLTDLDAANAALKSQIGTTSGTSSTASTTTNVQTTSETVIINQPGNVTGGVVNNQSGVTSYTLLQSDNASLVLLDDASPIAVSLPSNLTIPFYSTVSNAGTGAATLTPTTGTINGLASITVPGGSWLTIFLDGTNWWGDSPATGGSVGGVTQLLAGTNVTLSPTNGIGTVTVTVVGGTSGFNGGNNANGYWISDPLNHIHQWGTVTTDINGGTLLVTFPTPFTVLASVVPVVSTLSLTDRITWVVDASVTLTGFTIANNGSGGFATWSADGY